MEKKKEHHTGQEQQATHNVLTHAGSVLAVQSVTHDPVAAMEKITTPTSTIIHVAPDGSVTDIKHHIQLRAPKTSRLNWALSIGAACLGDLSKYLHLKAVQTTCSSASKFYTASSRDVRAVQDAERALRTNLFFIKDSTEDGTTLTHLAFNQSKRDALQQDIKKIPAEFSEEIYTAIRNSYGPSHNTKEFKHKTGQSSKKSSPLKKQNKIQRSIPSRHTAPHGFNKIKLIPVVTEAPVFKITDVKNGCQIL